MKKYTLHFRNSGIPFCFAEIMFKDKNSYGAFDYIVFYKGGLLEGYLSDKGIKDAKKFGLQLMKNHDMVYNKMLAFKKKAKNFEYTSWNDMKKFIEELGIIYLYCEQPVLAGIEEIFEKYCKNPIECLKDPSTCTFISEKGKISHDIISKFGRMKYDLHVILEKPMISFFNEMNNDPATFDFTEKEIKSVLSNSKKLKPNNTQMVIVDKTVRFDYDVWKKKFKIYDGIIKGKGVSLGKTVGKVKIFLDAFAREKIPDGTIIVSGMTNPQMTPYLKNAAAIVTDEGGMTCHAAIIARELHIPCIVGTGHATQVLKDGDMIEVDADKGIVKLL